jgi:uncharacterized protein YprB with RNaseH-like and TPR domain
MLNKTFVGLARLSHSAERKLWQHGILDWNSAERCLKLPLSQKKAEELRKEIRSARIAKEVGLVDWFLERLVLGHEIRVLPDFNENTAFIDIETTGLGRQDVVTTVAIYMAHTMHLFVRDINLQELLRFIPKIKLLITFNGTKFDLPFLRKTFRLPWAIPHIDLLYALKEHGFSGGQKKIENMLSIHRKQHIEGMTGSEAPNLWKQYKKGNGSALRQLLSYNAEDVWMLIKLALACFRFSTRSYPMAVEKPYYSEPDITQIIMQFDL